MLEVKMYSTVDDSYLPQWDDDTPYHTMLLRACLRPSDRMRLDPDEMRRIGTSLHIDMPEDYVGIIFARSRYGRKGLVLRDAMEIVTSGSMLDEVMLPMWNTTFDKITIHDGEPIAQMIVVPMVGVDIVGPD